MDPLVDVLVFARCAGFAFRAPGFSHPSTPATVRAGLAIFLAIGIAPGVAPPAMNLHDASFAIACVMEFLLGSAIGAGASIVYDGAYAGGRAVDDYAGIKAIAPSLQIVAPSGFGRIWSLAYTGGFFLLGAYRITVVAFAQSFAHVPLAAPVDIHALAAYSVHLLGTIVLVAVGVAAPAIGLAFVVQIAIGALSRAVPRFGSMTLIFPLAFAAALIATVLAVPAISDRALIPIVAFPSAHK
jgi:flagellar biosynthetic protein FliR